MHGATSPFSHVFMVWYLIKHTENFNLPLPKSMQRRLYGSCLSRKPTSQLLEFVLVKLCGISGMELI